MNPDEDARLARRDWHAGRRVVSLFVVIAGIAVASTTSLAAADNSAAPAASSEPYKFTNRLIESNDPYLLLHAHNPVDWYPWGPEAFAKAKKENKPIFLSIGYSTCYWCHVAERTVYSDPEIAKLMNQWFVNVKVDSEQRPDVDGTYMLARQLMTGSGGGPNNLFLTPDLKPFFAGSNFSPKDDPEAGPGFPAVLAAINQAWASYRAQTLMIAENVITAMRRVRTAMAATAAAPAKPDAWLAKVSPCSCSTTRSIIRRRLAIVVKFPRGSLGRSSAVQGSVTAQACNNQNCLPPSTLPIAVGDR